MNLETNECNALILAGSAPRHIVATCGNRFFKLVPFDYDDDDLVPWPVNKLEAFFLQLEKFVENNPRDDTVSIGHLTAADRTSWAKVRTLINMQIYFRSLQSQTELIKAKIRSSEEDSSRGVPRTPKTWASSSRASAASYLTTASPRTTSSSSSPSPSTPPPVTGTTRASNSSRRETGCLAATARCAKYLFIQYVLLYYFLLIKSRSKVA